MTIEAIPGRTVAPPSRRLCGGRPARPGRGRDALKTAGKMPALHFVDGGHHLAVTVLAIRLLPL